LDKIMPRPAEMNASRTGNSTQKTLQECIHSSKASGATPVGALAHPHEMSQRLEGKKVLTGSISLCGFLRIPPQRLGGYYRRRPWGSPNNRGNHPFLKINDRTHNYKSRPTWRNPRQRKAHAQKASATHQTASTGTPPANLHLAPGADPTPQNPSPRSRVRHPFSAPPPRSRALAPRVSSHPARGCRPLG
jgi:hypothetical protein